MTKLEGRIPPAKSSNRRPSDRMGKVPAARAVPVPESTQIPERSERGSGPRWGRIALVFGGGVGMAVLLLAISLWYVAQRAIDDIPVAPLDAGVLEKAKGDEPQNILLIGSDERSDPNAAGKRSDTLLIIRLNPAAANPQVLSLPRDTRVAIPGRGEDKINAAFAHGGPQLTIETIRATMGIPIHHYVEINFDGLTNLVDALGGVEICVDEPMRDPKVNIWFGSVGCYQVNGAKALVFARSRTMQILRDGKWQEDGTADIGRIHRQQLLMKAIMKRAVSIRSVGNWREIAGAVRKGVIIDDGLGLTQFLELYERFSNPEGLDTRTLPGHSNTINGTSYWIPASKEAELIYETFGARPTAR